MFLAVDHSAGESTYRTFTEEERKRAGINPYFCPNPINQGGVKRSDALRVLELLLIMKLGMARQRHFGGHGGQQGAKIVSHRLGKK